MVEKPPTSARDKRDTGLTPGSGRSPGEGHGYPLQYACLENSMDREAWQATVHGLTKELDVTEHTGICTALIGQFFYSSIEL